MLQRGENIKKESSTPVHVPSNLRAALQQICSNATSLFDTTDLKLDAISLKLKEFEEKKQELVELGNKCTDLIAAATKVRDYVETETDVRSLKKRDRDSAGLETFGDHANHAVRACKKIKEHK